MTRIYKFRSLADENAFDKRVRPILTEGKFWCARFWNLNDPMEGVYYSHRNLKATREIFRGKTNRCICSFSGEEALRRPLMWGYYAGGFKGLAIELEDHGETQMVRYTDNVIAPDPSLELDQQVDLILCNKLKLWEHEVEHRYLITGDEASHRVGSIRAVVLGMPYPASRLSPADRGGRMPNLEKYFRRLKKVETLARNMRYRIDIASFEGDKVEIHENGKVDDWIAS